MDAAATGVGITEAVAAAILTGTTRIFAIRRRARRAWNARNAARSMRMACASASNAALPWAPQNAHPAPAIFRQPLSFALIAGNRNNGCNNRSSRRGCSPSVRASTTTLAGMVGSAVMVWLPARRVTLSREPSVDLKRRQIEACLARHQELGLQLSDRACELESVSGARARTP